ncbi:hypothetical protein [Bacillus sp. EAC]|uniref:hypothetical protein n=1 Tax=Bacillus sp. EAC TaxID=1978338 RepID=UPI000B453D1A|nr:hypothetical protein [Bacillus sp. EAC]
MKKILLLSIILFLISPSVTYGSGITNPKCPNTDILVQTSENDMAQLLSALNEIIPNVYGDDQLYKEWKVVNIQPASQLKGYQEVYKKIATTYCGKNVADHSWFVRLVFPKILPATSAATGELFIVKDKNNKWIPWYQYH